MTLIKLNLLKILKTIMSKIKDPNKPKKEKIIKPNKNQSLEKVGLNLLKNLDTNISIS